MEYSLSWVLGAATVLAVGYYLTKSDVFSGHKGIDHIEGDLEDWMIEDCLAHLLHDGIIFASEVDNEEGVKVVVLYVNVNDVFVPAADAEPLGYDEVINLYEHWRADKTWGHVKWCAERRGQRPWQGTEATMKEFGVWDDTLESLPK